MMQDELGGASTLGKKDAGRARWGQYFTVGKKDAGRARWGQYFYSVFYMSWTVFNLSYYSEASSPQCPLAGRRGAARTATETAS